MIYILAAMITKQHKEDYKMSNRKLFWAFTIAFGTIVTLANLVNLTRSINEGWMPGDKPDVGATVMDKLFKGLLIAGGVTGVGVGVSKLISFGKGNNPSGMMSEECEK
ncbi:MAG: hypothetical protein LBS16_06270 [Prevotellaceae bacterium]|jgi:hypothetical protein|nr:hypothetical protein [Prevotellaceae bacterium]